MFFGAPQSVLIPLARQVYVRTQIFDSQKSQNFNDEKTLKNRSRNRSKRPKIKRATLKISYHKTAYCPCNGSVDKIFLSYFLKLINLFDRKFINFLENCSTFCLFTLYVFWFVNASWSQIQLTDWLEGIRKHEDVDEFSIKWIHQHEEVNW